jgi:hypothetical protein
MGSTETDTHSQTHRHSHTNTHTLSLSQTLSHPRTPTPSIGSTQTLRPAARATRWFERSCATPLLFLNSSVWAHSSTSTVPARHTHATHARTHTLTHSHTHSLSHTLSHSHSHSLTHSLSLSPPLSVNRGKEVARKGTGGDSAEL